MSSSNVSGDLLSTALAAPTEPAGGDTAGGRETSVDSGPFTTGVLPIQHLEYLVRGSKEIQSLTPIQDNQFQPASLDLRLGSRAYRVRASFLPGKNKTVKECLEDLSMHSMDITDGGVLERGCVYIVPLLESLAIKGRTTSASGNPKSSTGRLDIFTRLITDYGTKFDRVDEQYCGPLYAEVAPRTFSALVRKGSRLCQLRIRRGNPPMHDEKLKKLQQSAQLVSNLDDALEGGVPITVDVTGEKSGGIIGYRAKSHAGLIDVDQVRAYDVLDYWDPVMAPRRGGLVLDPRDFYILASKEAVRVPSTHAAEMIAYDTLVGEFRVHYAGFFDPGFGDPDADGKGARAVLEVRSYEVPFLIEDKQVVGKLVYERLLEPPRLLYGRGINSSYQGQGIALSKHFRPMT